MFYLPYNKKLKNRSRELRKNMTITEKKLWKLYLQKCEYTVNRQKIIDNFIVDFYCAAKKIVIEIDGSQHYTDEGKRYDEERTKILEGYGLTVIRFSNYDVINDFESVLVKLKEYMS